MRYTYKDCDDFKIMLPGSQTQILVLRRWNDTMGAWWCAFWHQRDGRASIATYEVRSSTPEEAIAKFIKYEIEGYTDLASYYYHTTNQINHIKFDVSITANGVVPTYG